MTTVLSNTYSGSGSVAVQVPFQPVGYYGLVFALGNSVMSLSDPAWVSISSQIGAPLEFQLWGRAFTAPVVSSDTHRNVTVTSSGAIGRGTAVLVITLSVAYGSGFNTILGSSVTGTLDNGPVPPATLNVPNPFFANQAVLLGIALMWIAGVTSPSLIANGPLTDVASVVLAANEDFGLAPHNGLGIIAVSSETAPVFTGSTVNVGYTGAPTKSNSLSEGLNLAFAITGAPDSLVSLSVPPLHIPHKGWAEESLEHENYSAIERWVHRLKEIN